MLKDKEREDRKKLLSQEEKKYQKILKGQRFVEQDEKKEKEREAQLLKSKGF